jgi:ADP-heptose:LPS heptosyltransferase
MQDVISQLAEHIKFYFWRRKKEIEILDALSNSKDNVINVAGKMKLQQELALISNLDVMVSMDSGNAHIAAMLGVKSLHWGATHPYAGFSPFHQPLENTLVSDREQYPMLPTSVYGNKIVVIMKT